MKKASVAAAALLLTAACTSAEAFEGGSPGWEQKPGLTLGGGTAGAPPPGLYMFDQFLTYQAKLVGPSAPNIGGRATAGQVAGEATGARVGYDFGPVALNVWALDELSSNATGSTPATGAVTKGYTVFASVSYRLWAPDQPAAPSNPLIHK